jgi:hypothetical protein
MVRSSPYLAALTLLLVGAGSVRADFIASDPGPVLGPVGAPPPPPAVAITAQNTGWYDQTGFHDAANTNYISGRLTNNEHRNFTVFSLSGLSGPIVSAQLQLFNPGPPFPGYSSPKPSEIFTLFDVSTPIPTLVANQTGQTGIFTDLGTGVPLGAQVVSAADDGNIVTVTLNPAGLAALNAAEGRQIAFGGAITTLDPTTTANEYIFGFANGPGTVQLIVTAVPEPASLILMGMGLVVPLAYGWHRRRTARVS